MLRPIQNIFGVSSGAADPLSRWIPYSSFLDDYVFLTKTGCLGMSARMEGCEYDTRTQEQLEQIAKRLVIANRQFDKRFRVYHHMLKREGVVVQRKPDYGNTEVNRAIAERAEYLESEGLYSIDLYTTVLLDGKTSGFPILDRLIESRLKREMNSRLEESINTLQAAMSSYSAALGQLLGVSVLDKNGCYQLLRALVNPEIEFPARLKYETDVDYFAADTAIGDQRTHLEWGNFDARIFTLKEEPDSTVAHILRDLMRIRGNFIVTVEWKPNDRAPMIEKIKRKRRREWSQRTSAVEGAIEKDGARLIEDAASTDNAESLNEAIREMRNRGGYFCDYSLTVVVFDRDSARLRRSCQSVKQVFDDKEASLLEEGRNRKRAFFATIPGNQALNLRYRSLLNTNIADLTPAYRPSAGSPVNDYLDDEYMTVMESSDGTPVYLNLHHGEVASTLITGTTGSGKSLFLDQIIDDGCKYDPFTFVIDVGGSHRLITKRHAGSYVQVRLNDKSFGVNPFRQPYTPQSVNGIHDFIRVLLANEGYELTAEEGQLVLNEIHAVYGMAEHKRRIGRMSLSKSLSDKLHMWLNGGAFSHFVDSARDDLQLTDFQTWDFTDLEQVPKLLGPLIWYMSRWISGIVTDARYANRVKSCYMDEGWRFGDLHSFIRSAAKTWRKHRAWIVFATQDEDDLRKADLLNLVNTCCHTKIFLSNPGADMTVYGDTFKLNERERQLLEQMKIGEFLVKTPTSSRKCFYRLSPTRLAQYESQFMGEPKEIAVQ